jgi:S-formylglutathione hydrolase FrmB
MNNPQRTFTVIIALLLVQMTFASRVDSVMIAGKTMAARPCTIIFPDQYEASKDSFTVTYLLHGRGGNHSNWLRRVPELKQYADAYQTIIVCPDGDTNSFYLNSSVPPQTAFATYVGEEIPAWMEQHYRIRRGRENCAITGLSMGGPGALLLAGMYPQRFGKAGSMSGVADLLAMRGRNALEAKIGADTLQWQLWSVWHRLDSNTYKNTALIIDCGTGDFLINTNRELHKKMTALQVPHVYMEREGAHSWDYWRESIRYHLFFFWQKSLEKNK